jgi:hypothetical protein
MAKSGAGRRAVQYRLKREGRGIESPKGRAVHSNSGQSAVPFVDGPAVPSPGTADRQISVRRRRAARGKAA